MARFVWQWIWIYGLAPRSKIVCFDRYHAEIVVAYHDTLYVVTLRGNYVTSKNRHWVTITVIFKSC